jgi:hypothetical protein
MTTRHALATAIALTMSLPLSHMAKADTQDFPKPMYKGHLLDWCLNWAADCGKPAADAWCKTKGFDDAKNIHKWENPGQQTRVIGSGQVCDDAECDAFAQITCEKADSGDDEETFHKPKYKGARLDWCLSWATDCGKPAADAYCDWKGYTKSTGFQIDENIGHTKIISSGQLCDDPQCDGFKTISCK